MDDGGGGGTVNGGWLGGLAGLIGVGPLIGTSFVLNVEGTTGPLIPYLLPLPFPCTKFKI